MKLPDDLSHLGERVPVEPLGDARWERLERRLLDARDVERAPVEPERRRVWAWGVVGVALAAAVVALFVVRRGTAPAPLRVVTPVGGAPTQVELGDAVVALGADTAAEIERGDGGVTVRLVRGQVDCDVEPRAGRAPFRVHAADVEVEVVGTRFVVARGDTVEVRVLRGKVRVASVEGKRTLAAGESWTAPVTAARAGEGRAIAQAPPMSDTPATTGPPAGGPVKSASAPASAPASTAAPVAKKPASQPVAASEPQPRPQSPHESSVDRRHELIDAHNLQAHDASSAARRYRQLAYGDDTVAARALEDLAYVELFHLHDPQAAIDRAEEYERRFPRGEDAADALWLRMEAYEQLGDHAAARRLAERYLQRFPREQKATRARIILGYEPQ